MVPEAFLRKKNAQRYYKTYNTTSATVASQLLSSNQCLESSSSIRSLRKRLVAVYLYVTMESSHTVPFAILVFGCVGFISSSLLTGVSFTGETGLSTINR